MNARTETLPLADLNRFRHGMNAEEGTQLKVSPRSQDAESLEGKWNPRNRNKPKLTYDDHTLPRNAKTDVFPQIYRRRKETNRRKGSGRKTKTRTFQIER